MKQTITTKTGTTYERTVKEKKYDTVIAIRINEKDYKKLTKIANKENIKVRTLIREILEDYLGE